MASQAPASDRRSIALTVAIAVAIAAAGGVLWWRTRQASEAATPRAGAMARPGEAAPEARPGPPPSLVDGAAERNRRLSHAPVALQSHEVGAKAYADAVAAGEKNPGEQAFRAEALAYYEHNGDLAEERLAKEGITADELKELTYLGLLAMHIRRWDEVSRVTGRELTADERAKGDELVFSASNALKAAIRGQVARGAPIEARWETIRKQEARFLEQYKALVGITPEAYDRLLSLSFSPKGN